MSELNNILCKKSKRCINNECKKHASFNYDNKKPEYCFDHKSDGMINIKNKNKKCISENCKNYHYIILKEKNHYYVQIIRRLV